MRQYFLLSGLAVAILVSLAACASNPVTGPARLLAAECTLLPPPPDGADTVSVAIEGSSTFESEVRSPERIARLLSGQLYETLIRIDCAGMVRPELAAGWKASDSGKVWSFTLHNDASFWDGSPVTARDVLESWNRSGSLDSIIVSVREDGEDALSVRFRRAYSEVPASLASFAFSVSGPTDSTGFPRGTGSYRVTSSGSGYVSTAPVLPASRLASFEFIDIAHADSRDLLEKEVDLLISRDPYVIEYALQRPNLVSVALPWDRMYVLLSTTRVQSLQQDVSSLPLPPVFPDELFIDAVRGEARISRLPPWWNDSGSCRTIISIPTALMRPRFTTDDPIRIIYQSSDDAARQVAERIVAISAMNAETSPAVRSFKASVPGMSEVSTRLISTGTDPEEFAASLKSGADFGYILPIPRRPYDACTRTLSLTRRAPWMVQPGSGLMDATIPLVDTRPQAIVVRNRLGLSVDWFGTVHLLTDTGGGRVK